MKSFMIFLAIMCLIGNSRGLTETKQSLPSCTPETRRKIYSSQQATEFLVSSWNDISTWPKRNESSSLCEQDVERVIAGYLHNEFWALQFFDAWTKLGPSLLDGQSNFVGNYQQCREARAPESDKRTGFHGNYCAVTITNLTHTGHLDPLMASILARLVLGTCLPSTCSEADAVKLFDERIMALNLTLFFKVASTDCRSNNKEYTTFTRVAIALVIIVGLLSASGTAINITQALWHGRASSNQDQQYKKTDGDDKTKASRTDMTSREATLHGRYSGIMTNVLLSFSVWTNWQKLVNTSPAPGSIPAIFGIRFFSMAWIVLGHTFCFLVFFYGSNAAQGQAAMAQSRLNDVLQSMYFAVDTFFAISGFLVSYHWIKTVVNKGWKTNWIYFYFHRYWRLTPPYLFVIILVQGLQGLMVSGAMAPTSQPVDKIMCEKNWWKHPLYINNILITGLSDACFSHSWSMAVDMQFYVISPLMLLPFYYHRFAGIASCLFFVIAQFLIVGRMAYQGQWRLGPSFPSTDWWETYYIQFYTRIAPFAFGVLAGYILSVNNGRVKMRPYQAAIGWILAISVGCYIVFGIHGDLSGNDPSSFLTSVLFYAMAKGIWGVCILWVIVACASGYGGPVNAFLTWPPFIVLGRVTYVGYLIQMSVFTIIFENLEQPVYMNFTSVFVFCIPALVFTIIAAAVVTIFVELPMLNLERVLLGRQKH